MTDPKKPPVKYAVLRSAMTDSERGMLAQFGFVNQQGLVQIGFQKMDTSDPAFIRLEYRSDSGMHVALNLNTGLILAVVEQMDQKQGPGFSREQPGPIDPSRMQQGGGQA